MSINNKILHLLYIAINRRLFIDFEDMGSFNRYMTMKFVSPEDQNDTSLYLTYKSLSLNDKGSLTDENPTILVNES